MSFDIPERAALHEAVGRECGGRFDLWAQKHGLTWMEVFEAAWFGGAISQRVHNAIQSDECASS